MVGAVGLDFIQNTFQAVPWTSHTECYVHYMVNTLIAIYCIYMSDKLICKIVNVVLNVGHAGTDASYSDKVIHKAQINQKF